MKTVNVLRFIFIFLIVVFQYIALPLPKVHAATSPSLGTADSFVILAGTNITNVPVSVITGDVGLSPATGAGIGLTAAQVTGTIYSVDAFGPAGSVVDPGLLTTAKNDLITAYDNLSAGANAACTTDYGAITKDLVGLTLVPGVYCADVFQLSGTLTLDDSGGADGVWIFRTTAAAAALTTTPGVGATVEFSTGVASACNVWWKVASSATIGSGTSFLGNILALTSISMGTSATLTGRVLARNGAVTLDQNTITNAPCAATPTPTPSTAPSSGSSSTTSTSGTGGTDACPTIDCVPQLIIESKRIDADSIYFSWGPYAGTDTFLIQYGLENGTWLWNTSVTGYSTTLNGLPSNQPIWVLISPRNSCSIAPCGVPKLIGGPKLPNTGFGPTNRCFSSSW